MYTNIAPIANPYAAALPYVHGYEFWWILKDSENILRISMGTLLMGASNKPLLFGWWIWVSSSDFYLYQPVTFVDGDSQ